LFCADWIFIVALFWYISPGLILLAAALANLLLDLVLSDEGAARWSSIVASAAAAASFVLVLVLGNRETRIASVLQYDAFTGYTWALIAGSLCLISVLSISYIRRQSQEVALFYAMLMFFGIAAYLLVASVNTIMLLLALDFLSIVSYVLTGFLHYDQRSTEAALKYLIYGAAVSALMAYGLAWMYGLTGTTDYAATSQALSGGIRAWTSSIILPNRPLLPVLVFVLGGLAFKVAAAPFHHWAPDAYEGAPAPVTAALAIIPKVAGLAAIVRITYTMLPETMALGAVWRWPLMTFLAVAALFFGNLAGLWQSNIKRLMAYSGIAQIGYALIGVAIASELGLRALLLYMSAYVFAEIGVFGAITVVSGQTGLDEIVDYRSLHRRAPALAFILIISLLSLGGVPGTGGFMGKLLIFSAVLEEEEIGLLVVAGLSTVVSLAYYWKIIRAAFLHSDHALQPVHMPRTALVVSIIAAAGVFIVGIYPNALMAWIAPAVHVFFP
jgi:NADH-quinone oxidoreductase subunit N